jgi:hypothetical protein
MVAITQGLSSGARLDVPRFLLGSSPFTGNCLWQRRNQIFVTGLAPVGQERVETLVGERMVKDLSQEAERAPSPRGRQFGGAQEVGQIRAPRRPEPGLSSRRWEESEPSARLSESHPPMSSRRPTDGDKSRRFWPPPGPAAARSHRLAASRLSAGRRRSARARVTRNGDFSAAIISEIDLLSLGCMSVGASSLIGANTNRRS